LIQKRSDIPKLHDNRRAEATQIARYRRMTPFEDIPWSSPDGRANRKLFAPGLRPSVTSCHYLALPVHVEEGLTG